MTPDATAIGCFFAFIALTLVVTAWAARRTRTAEDFLTAGGRIGAGQNGFALAGDYLSHDVWGGVVRRGRVGERETMLVARLAAVALATVGVLLGLVFEGENVAFMAGLAYAVACSANLPALLLAIGWRGLTTAGAVAAILTGATSALVMIALSPTIQVDVLGRAPADLAGAWWSVPLRNPAIVSMPLAFAAAVLVSLLTRNERDRAAYATMRRKVVFGALAPRRDARPHAEPASTSAEGAPGDGFPVRPAPSKSLAH